MTSMQGKTKIRANLDGLEKWRKDVGDKYVTRVGVLGGDAARTGGNTSIAAAFKFSATRVTAAGSSTLNNAELGLVQMLGSLKKKIPPRDWLRMPIEMKKREILRGIVTGKAKEAFNAGDFKKVYQILGIRAEAAIHEAFATGGFGQWPPLKPATIKRKGSDKPLIDTRQLERAVSSDVVEKRNTQTSVGAVNLGTV